MEKTSDFRIAKWGRGLGGLGIKSRVKDITRPKCSQEVCIIKRFATVWAGRRLMFAFGPSCCVVWQDCCKLKKTLTGCLQCANVKPQLLLDCMGEGG